MGMKEIVYVPGCSFEYSDGVSERVTENCEKHKLQCGDTYLFSINKLWRVAYERAMVRMILEDIMAVGMIEQKCPEAEGAQQRSQPRQTDDESRLLELGAVMNKWATLQCREKRQEKPHTPEPCQA